MSIVLPLIKYDEIVDEEPKRSPRVTTPKHNIFASPRIHHYSSLEDVFIEDVLIWKFKTIQNKPKGPLVHATPKDSLGTCLKLMAKHNILTVPVISNYGRLNEEKYHGMVDVFLILSVLMEESSSCRIESRKFDEMIVEVLEMEALMMIHHMSMPKDDYLNYRDTLQLGINKMTRNGYHRVTVIDEADPPHAVGVLTQNDILLFLRDYPQLIGSRGTFTLKELGLCRKPVPLVNENATLMQAFGLMCDHGIRELAVVDNAGRMLGSLNSGVLRGMTDFTELNSSIHHFATKYPLKQVELCSLEEQLFDVINKLAPNRPIRLYVLNSQSEPLYVVNLNSILHSLVQPEILDIDTILLV